MSEDTPKTAHRKPFWRRYLARAGFTSHQRVLVLILLAVLALYAGVLGKNIVKMASAGHEESTPPVISQAVDDVSAMETWFADHNYDLDLADPGSRADIPPIFVRSFPPDFHDSEDISAHKERFIEVMLPLVLSENVRLRRERAGLIALERKINQGHSLRPDEQAYLEDLADLYNAEEATPRALMHHVDEIPVSLALAQSAEESGWGRSRFVRQGNALFGQWTYNPDHLGIVPASRIDGARHRIRAFPSLRYSVRTYMRNLNSHRAYRAFRDKRAELRAESKALEGPALAATLTKYSQRGPAYVRSINAIIETNNLTAYSDAKLRL